MTTPTPRASAAADVHFFATLAQASRGNAARPEPPVGAGGPPTTDGRWGAPRAPAGGGLRTSPAEGPGGGS